MRENNNNDTNYSDIHIDNRGMDDVNGDDMMRSLRESLSSQVNEAMYGRPASAQMTGQQQPGNVSMPQRQAGAGAPAGPQQSAYGQLPPNIPGGPTPPTYPGYAQLPPQPPQQPGQSPQPPKKKKKHTALKVIGIILGVIILFGVWLVFTSSGKRFGTKIVAKFMYSSMVRETTADGKEIPEQSEVFTDKTSHAHRDYVKNFLVFGIEEFYGARNTDSMILVSLNTQDKTIKLTSFLRDTYVTIPGHKRNKLNAAYAQGGAELLTQVIEDTYDIEIEGYASVDFEAFEKIIDALGGVDIKLGKEEAKYLRHTNYISEKANRNVKKGWNHLNGNQAMGYCRVRKVPTLGGVDSDYGRTLRQRRTIKAMVKAFKSKNIFEMYSIAKECLGYVTTNVTEEQIADALFDIVDNKMYTVKTNRFPQNGLFYDSGKSGINGITYALVMDDKLEENRKALHKYLFHKPKTISSKKKVAETTAK